MAGVPVSKTMPIYLKLGGRGQTLIDGILIDNIVDDVERLAG